MNKQELIEELKKEIELTKNVLNCEEHFSLYAKGKRVGLEFGWMFAEKLDEPELPVIPPFDGHTVEPEPEKLYRVKFSKTTRSGREMYLEKNDEEGGGFSIDWSEKEFIENEYPDFYLFTEKEIKAIDERYWAFAEQKPEPIPEPAKTRQVLVKFFDSQEYKKELTEESARKLIEFLEAN